MGGTLMQAEMAEQPERLAALIDRRDEIAAVVQELRPQPLAGTTVVARGSSDHAGVYGRYLIEPASCRPAGLAAPSLQTLYGARVDYSGYLAIAVSQSGRTPEILTALERMQAAGAAGLAITNDAASPLAGAARATLALEAGDERAVPATKTVTATLTAFALVAAALGEPPFARAELSRVPEWVAQVLLGAALEAALKLKETTMMSAEGLSGADLRHGPIAIVEQGLPVLAFRADGPAHADMVELVEDLRGRGAAVYVAGAGDGADLPT